MSEASSLQEMREQLLQDRQRLIEENAALQQRILATSPTPVPSPASCTVAGRARRRLRRQPCLVAIPESVAEEDDDESDDAKTSVSNGSTRTPCTLDGSTCSSISEESRDTRTTLLLRNLPTQLSTCDLVRALEEAGFLDECTFAYMPADPTSSRGFGYALVDLTSHTAAECVREHFEGFRAWPSCQSEARCAVVWNPARQGLAALRRRYWDVACMAPLSRPYVNEA